MPPTRKLYIIGGTPRVGKSTIAKMMVKQDPTIQQISTDRIGPIIRNVLVGDMAENVHTVTFKTTVTYARPGEVKIYTKEFSRHDQSEDDLAWIGVVGLLENYFDRQSGPDVLIEGVAITPQRVHDLKLDHFDIRAAFVGYGSDSHAKSILEYSKRKKDWLYKEMEQNGKGDEHVSEMVREAIPQNLKMKENAEKFGYAYFDVSAKLFEEHVNAVMEYLLA
jgi:2-phosphoglycerate kinase